MGNPPKERPLSARRESSVGSSTKVASEPAFDDGKKFGSQGPSQATVVTPFALSGSSKWKLPFHALFSRSPPPAAGGSLDDAEIIPDVRASFLSLITFFWLEPLLELGYKRTLEKTDLWKLDPERESGRLAKELVANFERRTAKAEEWNRKLDTGQFKPSVLRRAWWRTKSSMLNLGTADGRQTAGLAGAISDTFFWQFWSAGVLKVVADTLSVTAPLVTKQIIIFGQDAYLSHNGVPGYSDPSVGKGIGLAIGLWAMLICSSLCLHQFFYRSMSVGVLTRAALIAAVYERAVKLSGKSRTTITNSKLVNHISTDVSRVDFCMGFAHMAWTAPVQFIVVCVILLVNLKYSALPGIAFVVIIGPLQTRLMRSLFAMRKKAMVQTDARVKLTQELLGGVKVIKFFAWEIPYIAKLNAIRWKELSQVRRLLVMKALNMSIALSVPVGASILAFITYSFTNQGNSAAVIFTSLTLFNLIRMPLMMLPMSLSTLTDAKAALDRLRVVFTAETVDFTYEIDRDSKFAIEVKDASFRFEGRPDADDGAKKGDWKKGGKAAKPPKKSRAQMREEKKQRKKQQESEKLRQDLMPPLRRRSSVLPDASSAAVAATGMPVAIEGEVEDKEARVDGSDAAVEGTVVSKGDLSVPLEAIKEAPIHLRNISMRIPHGQLTAIVGPVGSGKSALLQALIGEMKRVSGTVKFGSTVGYAAQQAWIQNATLRDNILFGRPFNSVRYERVIHDACLEADIDMLPFGDQTQIGEKGITLSGGQKQRVNIARALYFDADIVCLDDPLSAVDAHVGKHLFEHAIKGALAGKTRILVTHALYFLAQVDYIYCIEDGRISEHGTYADLTTNQGAFSRLMAEFGGQEKAEEEKEIAQEQDAIDGDKPKKDQRGGKHVLMQEEERAKGSVSLKSYARFFGAARGRITIPLLILALILTQAAQVVSTYVLVWWSEGEFPGRGNGFYMGLYAAIGCSVALFTFLMGFVAVIMGNNASRNLHAGAITGVMHAPASYFETTPLGRILSRFTKDIDVLDNTLNDSARMALATFGSVAGAIILIAIVQQYFLIAVGIILFFYFFAAKYYRASAREVKRLDNLLRSALYAHFSESLSGLATIRAYGEVDTFVKENQRLIDLEDRAYYLSAVNQRWLGLRLDLFGSILTFVVAIISVATRYSLNPSQIGVALSYIISVQQSFSWMVRQTAELENDMNSVERLIYYADSLEREAPAQIEGTEPPAEWPHQGVIDFDKVVMAYRPGLPPVLKGLSMHINAGEKLAIVGRTGAGKSSIMVTLFRMVELMSGTISIDGVDISKLGLEVLRSRLALIPQDALLFAGTIRSNLDPFGVHDDAKLWDALRRAWLVDRADGKEASRFTLDTVIEDEGGNLSVGERSLLSLARALVKGSRIVLADEATASVDLETDARIQQTFASEFEGKTLITIAHRLLTVIGYDRIVVMDAGEIAEMDTPANLFQIENGIFRSMCERSNIGLDDIRRARLAREQGKPVVIRSDEEHIDDA